MVIAILWVIIMVPESPIWLYEKRMFDTLESSFNQIAKVNNVPHHEQLIKESMVKLKKTAEFYDK